MRLRAKRRAVAAVIAFVAVWPALQHVVVERVGADPWLYFGMAMYCVPRHVSNMRVVVLRDGEPLAFAPERITPELNARLEQFRRLGRAPRTPRARPAPAPALARARPGAGALSLVLTVDSIDPATGMVIGRDTRLGVEPPNR